MVKTVLLFAVAVIGLRLAERRTLTQLNVFDLAVSIAVGAIVGRTATSSTTSFATGATALITMLLAHRGVAVLRRRGLLGRLLDRPPLLLIAHGRPRPEALKPAGLTERDLWRLLRQAGESEPDNLAYMLYEEHGVVTLIRPGQEHHPANHAGLTEAGINPTSPDPDQP
jgi:uncharacterized membrane protein YcaP (DUF421 family)